jgi:uncharacterized protein
MGEFTITVEQLTEKPADFVFEASEGWWAARNPGSSADAHVAEGPFTFTLTARRIREDVALEGSVAGRVGLECSRCAKRYSHALRDEFRLLLEPIGSREPADPESATGLARFGVCLGEDLEAGWFRGPRIRLEDFFGEVIALAVPIQPLCSETCPGICPHCGVDRGQTQCSCVDEKIESPFAVLAKLKDDGKQAEE